MRLSGFGGKTNVKANGGPARAGTRRKGRHTMPTRRIHEECPVPLASEAIAVEGMKGAGLLPALQDYPASAAGDLAKRRERPPQLTAGRSH